MSYYWQVTLNQGRSDTVLVEADSLIDVKNFFTAVSTATITLIKKVVYSKDLGIGSALTSYISNNENSYLNIMVKNSAGGIGTLNVHFPIKILSKDKIVEMVKKNLLFDGKTIVEVLNILVCE